MHFSIFMWCACIYLLYELKCPSCDSCRCDTCASLALGFASVHVLNNSVSVYLPSKTGHVPACFKAMYLLIFFLRWLLLRLHLSSVMSFWITITIGTFQSVVGMVEGRLIASVFLIMVHAACVLGIILPLTSCITIYLAALLPYSTRLLWSLAVLFSSCLVHR